MSSSLTIFVFFVQLLACNAAPRPLRTFSLGSKFSLGRARWTTDEGSIFSVADGRRLASTPPPNATYYENFRMAKIQKAALETPVVAGYRLLPEFTPGRAMLWGTILAIWGTAAVVVTAARQLDIKESTEASSKLRAVFAPFVLSMKERLAPLRAGMSSAAASGTIREDTSHSLLVQRLRLRFSPSKGTRDTYI